MADMVNIWYCTREDIEESLDFKESARNSRIVDRAIFSSTQSIEGQLRRVFYPTVDVRYKDWPNWQYAYPWRVWLDADELISVNTLTSGGVVIPPSSYSLEPANSGPPFTSIEMLLSSSSAFNAGSSTWQHSIAINGTFGFRIDEDPGGSLASAIISTSAITANVTDSASIGIGSLIRIDSERMIVTNKSMLTTGQTLQAPVSASTSSVTIAVVDGSTFVVNEQILLDSERMLIVDIAGNNLTVKRAYNGSVLAQHTGSTIYVGRALTVSRGVLGTTAATHAMSAPIAVHEWPGIVRQLCIAETVSELTEVRAGYMRQGKTGGSVAVVAQSRGLEDLRAQAFSTLGRQARSRAV